MALYFAVRYVAGHCTPRTKLSMNVSDEAKSTLIMVIAQTTKWAGEKARNLAQSRAAAVVVNVRPYKRHELKLLVLLELLVLLQR